MKLPRYSSDGCLIISVSLARQIIGRGDDSRAISLQETHLFAPGGLGSNCTEKGKKQRKCPECLG